MKLIIDIPEVFYEALRKTDEIISGQRSGKTLMSVIYNAVANGTPISDNATVCDIEQIRAEIERKANSGQWSEATIYGMQKSIAIIDKYKS